jgi:hypothetical protein
MQAMIELVLAVVAALAMAVFASLGGVGDSPRKAPSQAERVVARSPQAKPISQPGPVSECPEARAAASDVA